MSPVQQIIIITVYLIIIVFNGQYFIACSTLRNPPSDSILDIINTKEVERILAEKKKATANDNDVSSDEKRYLIDNELTDNYILTPEQELEIDKFKLLDDTNNNNNNNHNNNKKLNDNPRVDIDKFLRRNNYTEPYRNTELLQDLRGFNGRKLLKSSKNALFVTKKEYLQRDWCKTEPLIQKVKEDGCLTRTVINRFCYGQCNSFYIPKNPRKHNNNNNSNNRIQHLSDGIVEETEDEDLNGPAFKACAFCRPSKFTWVTITLRCPSMVPPFRKKRIQRIKQCKCTAANVD